MISYMRIACMLAILLQCVGRMLSYHHTKSAWRSIVNLSTYTLFCNLQWGYGWKTESEKSGDETFTEDIRWLTNNGTTLPKHQDCAIKYKRSYSWEAASDAETRMKVKHAGNESILNCVGQPITSVGVVCLSCRETPICASCLSVISAAPPRP